MVESTCPTCGAHTARINPTTLIAHLPLRPQERIIAEMLVKSFGRDVDSTRVTDAMYADREDGGPENACHVRRGIVWRLKRQLEPYGITVRSRSNGRGGGGLTRMSFV